MTPPARPHARTSRRGLRRAGAIAACLALALPIPAQETSIRYGTVTAEPIRLAHTGPLLGEAAAPTRAAFAVMLITPDGQLPAQELQEFRAAAQKVADVLISAARVKFGTELPLTHEVVLATPAEAAAHRERLKQAGFTFINRSMARTSSQRVAVENFGLKEYAKDAVLGQAELTLAITARPVISAGGDIKLHLEVAAEDARATPGAPGTDEAAVQAALARFQKETIEQAKGMLFAANWRKWTLTRRDFEAIALGAVPLRKAVPLEVLGQAARLRLTIPATLVFSQAGGADAVWEAPE